MPKRLKQPPFRSKNPHSGKFHHPKRGISYKQGYFGEWYRPKMTGYRTKCCDCGLVHMMDFRIRRVGGRLRVYYRTLPNRGATAAARRGKNLRLLRVEQ